MEAHYLQKAEGRGFGFPGPYCPTCAPDRSHFSRLPRRGERGKAFYRSRKTRRVHTCSIDIPLLSDELPKAAVISWALLRGTSTTWHNAVANETESRSSPQRYKGRLCVRKVVCLGRHGIRRDPKEPGEILRIGQNPRLNFTDGDPNQKIRMFGDRQPISDQFGRARIFVEIG